MNNHNQTHPTYTRHCLACLREFDSRFEHAPYCERCLLDRVLVTHHLSVDTWRGGANVALDVPALLPAALGPAAPDPAAASRPVLTALQASARYGADRRATDAALAECELARKSRRRGLSGAAAASLAVAGVALFWILAAMALSAWRGY